MYETTHESFLGRLADRDPNSWDQVVQRYEGLLRAYARRAGLQDADIDDLRQEVWTSMARQLPKFRYDRAKGRFRDYLGTVCANAVRRIAKNNQKQDKRLDTVVAATIESSEPSADASWLEEWRNHHYRMALRALRGELEARTLNIFEALLDGRDIDAVAADFDVSRSAIYKIRTRVKERMREQIRVQVEREDAVLEVDEK